MSKTQKMLIDVARQLFAKLGVENTTMNDIAVASHKGRRTLYTYFNNKNDVYQAVLEAELEMMQKDLQSVASMELPADEKLFLFFDMRFETIKQVVARNGTLKADFFRDIWQVQSVRKSFDKRETQILIDILKQGVEEGIFDIPNVDSTAAILHYALRGLELPFIRGKFVSTVEDEKRLDEDIKHIIFDGIRRK